MRSTAPSVLSHALVSELRRRIRGEVRFDPASRALYATDASNYRQLPIGVVYPKDAEDVVEILTVARQFDVPILPRGAGTSIAGQCCNVAVVLDFSRYMNRILEIDPLSRTARVEPGVVLDRLREAVAPYGLTFGPDPATHNRCTLGGMIGNNACGVHSLQTGRTSENVEALEVLTYDGHRLKVTSTPEDNIREKINSGGRVGEIYQRLVNLRDRTAELVRLRYPGIPRRVSGYNLDELLPEKGFHVARALVGSEGTCVTILEATVRLVPDPPARVLAVVAFPDVFQAADEIPALLSLNPIGLEGIDEAYIRRMKKKGMHVDEIRLLPEGGGWLLVEFGGASNEVALEQAIELERRYKGKMPRVKVRIYSDPFSQKLVWSVRESSFGASVFVPQEKDTYSGFEDSAVAPERLGSYLRELATLYKRYDYQAITYGHFGEGCVHSRISFDLRSAEGIKKYRSFLVEAVDLVGRYGGSLSGEHGDGQKWGEFLPKMFGEELVQAFCEFKSIWDPANRMNPGKMVKAYRIDENLRFGGVRKPPKTALHFAYQEEKGDFSRATERCIGLGKCLKRDRGIMCPSFMVTGEERHSTRGRAHLLHEMMRGEILTQGWKNRDVKESLDLCLSCKGCLAECPVNVDMATYKAEFLSHYYRGRVRPFHAYLFAFLSRWLPWAAAWPEAMNFVTHHPFLSRFVKAMAGIHPQRKLPQLAQQPFSKQLRQLGSVSPRGRKVLLWVDTFNNFYYPHVLEAARDVLEVLGFQVLYPRDRLCCGRTFYDFGFLKEAKVYLKRILVSLKEEIAEGLPLVILEPSCTAVFRNELRNLFPDEAAAIRLSAQSFLLSEFLEQFLPDFEWPRLSAKAVVHGHCHQKAVMGMKAEESLLAKVGIDAHFLDAGCCGMAGAFGFEKGHYDLSVRIAERALIPALRQLGEETLVITNGFSCREQIQQLIGRTSLHLSEVLHTALVMAEEGGHEVS